MTVPSGPEPTGVLTANCPPSYKYPRLILLSCPVVSILKTTSHLTPVRHTAHTASSNAMANIPSDSIEDLEKGTVSYQENLDYGDMSRNHIRPRDTSKTACTLSSDGETVFLGGMAIDRSDLTKVFQQSGVVQVERTNFRPLGNPIPLGLVGYGVSTFTLGLILMQARGVTNPKLLISSSLMFSGLVTLICGLWCLLLDMTFAATALAAFGGFYLSYSVILIDAFGIVSSYSSTEEFNNAMGFWLSAWTIYATVMWLLTWKGTVEFCVLIGLIVLYLLTLSISYFVGSLNVQKAAGCFAFLSAIVAFYCVWSMQTTDETSHVIAPVLMMPGHKRKAKRL